MRDQIAKVSRAGIGPMLSIFLGAFNVSIGIAAEKTAASAVRVQVETSQPAYVLGEPVDLQITVTNAGKEPIRMMEFLLEGTEPEILVYISDNGTEFRQWALGSAIINVERPAVLLAPKEPIKYRMQIVYDHNRKDHLAFDRSGHSWIKLRLPLQEMDPPYTRTEIDSNTIRIEIREPQGEDAKAWNRIDDSEMFFFLQTGGGKDAALRAAALLKSTHNTVYTPALRDALKRHYHRYYVLESKLDENEAQLIRSVTGIELIPPQPFPNDKRLDQIITYHFPEPTEWEEVLEQFSEQSGIKLEADSTLRGRRKTSVRVTKPLREIMHNMAAHRAEWVRQGDGYFLRAVENAKERKE